MANFNPNEPRDQSGKWTDAGISAPIQNKMEAGLTEEEFFKETTTVAQQKRIDAVVESIQSKIDSDKITPDQVGWMEQYTETGYADINRGLRNDLIKNPESNDAIKNIDGFIDNSPHVDSGLEVYRVFVPQVVEKVLAQGSGEDYLKEQQTRLDNALQDVKNQFQPGNIISDKGYGSTSYSNKFVHDKLEGKANASWAGAVIPGVWVKIDLKDGVPLEGISVFKNEKEILIPRNAKFQVLDTKFQKNAVVSRNAPNVKMNLLMVHLKQL